MTDEERKADRIKMALWPLVMAGLYAILMLIGREGEMLVRFYLFFDWLLVRPFGFAGSIIAVAGFFYFLCGFLLLGNDPHGERQG